MKGKINRGNFRKSVGFTLVELLVTVAVIGVLMGLVVVVLNPAHFRNQAQDGRRVSDLGKIQTTLELSFADNNQYPETLPAGSPTDPDGGSYTYCPNISNYLSYNLCAILEVVDPTTVSGCTTASIAPCTGLTGSVCCLTNPF